MLAKAREKEITDEERDELVTLCIVRAKNRRQDSRSNIDRYRWSAYPPALFSFASDKKALPYDRPQFKLKLLNEFQPLARALPPEW